MIIIKADNRSILKDAKFSYLSTSYASGVTTLVVDNVNGFSANDFILLGEFGSESAEIVQVGTVTTATNTIVIKAGGVTVCAHSESTKAYLVPYNQVKFYWTATATFATGTQLGSTADIQSDDYYTKYTDNSNTTGFGWFVFYNSQSALTSTNSNAIPYAGFAENSAKNIIDSFFSSLNNKETSLVTYNDAFKYLSEAHSRAQNNLNLVNDEYNTQLQYTITVPAGTKEVALPNNFSDMVALSHDGISVPYCNTWDIMTYDANPVTVMKYYLRGSYIGFTPTPQADMTFYAYYKSKSTAISSLYDTLDYPDNNFYPLMDFMMYRACPKLGRSRQEAESYLVAFNNGIELMKVTSIKQSSNLDAWEVDPTANV